MLQGAAVCEDGAGGPGPEMQPSMAAALRAGSRDVYRGGGELAKTRARNESSTPSGHD